MQDLGKVMASITPRSVNNICNRVVDPTRMNPNLARLDIREQFFLYNEMRIKAWS